MNHLRLTPSNSPFFKSATPRSPTKSKNEEPGLRLQKVIGTTTLSANGFDCLPSALQFAYTAGAAAVVCKVDENLQVTQWFFRARPSGYHDASVAWPASPASNVSRNRILAGARDQTLSGSTLGTSARDWPDSPAGKTATAKDRVKAATSVALSPNGKWIAVGETGYKPRVLIFSNTGESSDIPVSALSEHTFGVNALRFSPDSQYLASLGTVNDGFLYVWSIMNGNARLHSSNKCTSVINAMIWVGGAILTIGLRFVKIWRPTDDAENRILDASNPGTPRQKPPEFGNSILNPKHRVLAGKNILLGDLIDANFVAAVAIDNKAVVCADSGEICMLDPENTGSLTPVGFADFRISAARTDREGKLIVSGAGQSKQFDLRDLHNTNPTRRKRSRRSTSLPANALVGTIATATMGEIVVEIDSKRGITLTRSGESTDDLPEIACQQLPAHDDAVLGVLQLTCKSLPEAAFLTFAGTGSVRLWTAGGGHVSTLQVPVETSVEMYDSCNELRAVAHLPQSSLLATGDRYGIFSMLDISDGSIKAQVRAHSAEVTDIVTFVRGGVGLIATASRDRMIQCFIWNDNMLALLQTMDEHAAAVGSLLEIQNGSLLLSCSVDRTVVVREAVLRDDHDPTSVAFIILRTIMLKSSPTSMCLGSNNDELLVAAVDKSISQYNVRTGQAGSNFKCSDPEGGEATVMSRILYAPALNSNPTIVGVSTVDKSVRLYSDYGTLIARDWGHTEGITDVALLAPALVDDDGHRSDAQLVTVAADSTVFLWNTASQNTIKEDLPEVNGISVTPTMKRATAIPPPLRRVLSQTDISRYRRQTCAEDTDQSPTAAAPIPTHPSLPPSPRRVRKKPSRTSVIQPPRLEPAFRSDTSRKTSLGKPSPSPPSPRAKSSRDAARKPSLGMTLRSKSSENVLSSYVPNNASNNSSTFGSLSSSTEAVCRTLRSYRKRLANAHSTGTLAPEVLQEIERELGLTSRLVRQTIEGGYADRLDEVVEDDGTENSRKQNGSFPQESVKEEKPVIVDSMAPEMDADALAGALETVKLRS